MLDALPPSLLYDWLTNGPMVLVLPQTLRLVSKRMKRTMNLVMGTPLFWTKVMQAAFPNMAAELPSDLHVLHARGWYGRTYDVWLVYLQRIIQDFSRLRIQHEGKPFCVATYHNVFRYVHKTCVLACLENMQPMVHELDDNYNNNMYMYVNGAYASKLYKRENNFYFTPFCERLPILVKRGVSEYQLHFENFTFQLYNKIVTPFYTVPFPDKPFVQVKIISEYTNTICLPFVSPNERVTDVLKRHVKHNPYLMHHFCILDGNKIVGPVYYGPNDSRGNDNFRVGHFADQGSLVIRKYVQ